MSGETAISPDTMVLLIAAAMALTAFGTGIFLATRRRWALATLSVLAGIAAALAAFFFSLPMTRLF